MFDNIKDNEDCDCFSGIKRTVVTFKNEYYRY